MEIQSNVFNGAFNHWINSEQGELQEEAAETGTPKVYSREALDWISGQLTTCADVQQRTHAIAQNTFNSTNPVASKSARIVPIKSGVKAKWYVLTTVKFGQAFVNIDVLDLFIVPLLRHVWDRHQFEKHAAAGQLTQDEVATAVHYLQEKQQTALQKLNRQLNAALGCCPNYDYNKIKLLIEAGANPNIRTYNTSGRTPLNFAIDKEHLILVETLIKATGIDLEVRNRSGGTALHYAACFEKPKSIPLLLQAGANPNAQRKDGSTPLMLAIKEGNLAAAEYLIKAKGIDLEVRDKYGATALHHAAWFNQPKIIPLLLQAGANPNAKRENGSTPLMLAIYRGKLEATQALLNAGADWRISNDNGYTAERYAQTNPKLGTMLTLHISQPLNLQRVKSLAASKTAFSSAINPQLFARNLVFKLKGSTEPIRVNAALLIKESPFLGDIVKAQGQEELKDEDIPLLKMTCATYQILETYATTLKVDLSGQSINDLLKLLTSYEQYQCLNIATRVESEIVGRLTETSKKAEVEKCLDLAIRLHRPALVHKCRELLKTTTTPLPKELRDRRPAVEKPGFHALFDTETGMPKPAGIDHVLKVGGDEFPVHELVMVNAKMNSITDKEFTKETVSRFLQLIYTGELDPELTQKNLEDLVKLAQEMKVAAPFLAFIEAAYLNLVINTPDTASPPG